MADQQHTSARISVPVFKLFSILVCIIAPLTCSAFMGARFLQTLGTGTNGWILLLGAGALLASSALLGTMAGRCKSKGSNAIAVLCLFAWLVIVCISTSTSALSLLDTSGDTINNQVQGSNEYRNIQASIKANLAAIAGLQDNISNAPSNWLTKKSQWTAQISGIQDQNRLLINNQNRLSRNQSGSTVADAFNRIGSLLGLSGASVRLLLVLAFAIALDLLPFSAGCALGFLYGVSPVKKSKATQPKRQKPKLEAVA